jgi:hypothetical protein
VTRRTAFDAGLFLCTGLSIASLFILQFDFLGLDWRSLEGIVAAGTALGFVGAAVLVVLRPRRGYLLGLMAGFVALGLLLRREWTEGWSSWAFFNISDAAYFRGNTPAAAKMRIIAPALAVVAVSVCLFRRRRWLAFAVAAVVVGTWFGYSVTPYRVIGFNHGTKAGIRILHVQKRGLSYHETAVVSYRQGMAWVSRHDRRLFQYQFEQKVSVVWGEPRAQGISQAPALARLRTGPAKRLWAWNAEGWYVVLNDSRVLFFETPPDEVKAAFEEVEEFPAARQVWVSVRDVCMGFCYDPLAALGFSIQAKREQLLREQGRAEARGL